MSELIILTLLVILAAGVCVWCVYMLAGEFLGGAAFVPTNQKDIEKLLEKLKIKPGQVFYDLGSGDGRVVKHAVKNYQARGIGVEINPWLLLWSRLTSKKDGLTNIKFISQDFWKMNLNNADYIYFYMSPRSAEKFGKKVQKECRRGTVLISKAFEIKTMRDKLVEAVLLNGKRYWIYKI